MSAFGTTQIPYAQQRQELCEFVRPTGPFDEGRTLWREYQREKEGERNEIATPDALRASSQRRGAEPVVTVVVLGDLLAGRAVLSPNSQKRVRAWITHCVI